MSRSSADTSPKAMRVGASCPIWKILAGVLDLESRPLPSKGRFPFCGSIRSSYMLGITHVPRARNAPDTAEEGSWWQGGTEGARGQRLHL
eukprot:4624167-Prymnesium_polylepis.1